jgi:hypothetical protein
MHFSPGFCYFIPHWSMQILWSRDVKCFFFAFFNHWVMHPVARVSTNICRNLAPTFVAYGGFYICCFFFVSVNIKIFNIKYGS